MGAYLGQSVYNDSQVTPEELEELIEQNGKGVFWVKYNTPYNDIMSAYQDDKILILVIKSVNPPYSDFFPLERVTGSGNIIFSAVSHDNKNEKIVYTVNSGGISETTEELVTIDTALDSSSHNPVENMAISAELTAINNKITGDLNDIFLALASKGVTVPAGAGLDDVAGLIEEVPTGTVNPPIILDDYEIKNIVKPDAVFDSSYDFGSGYNGAWIINGSINQNCPFNLNSNEIKNLPDISSYDKFILRFKRLGVSNSLYSTGDDIIRCGDGPNLCFINFLGRKKQGGLPYPEQKLRFDNLSGAWGFSEPFQTLTGIDNELCLSDVVIEIEKNKIRYSPYSTQFQFNEGVERKVTSIVLLDQWNPPPYYELKQFIIERDNEAIVNFVPAKKISTNKKGMLNLINGYFAEVESYAQQHIILE